MSKHWQPQDSESKPQGDSETIDFEGDISDKEKKERQQNIEEEKEKKQFDKPKAQNKEKEKKQQKSSVKIAVKEEKVEKKLNKKDEELEEEKKPIKPIKPKNSQKFDEEKIINIIPLGGSGVGKSHLSNVMLDGKNGKRFVASESTEGGETKTISQQEGFALNRLKISIRIYDIPGLGDPDLSISDLFKQVIENLNGKRIDAIIVVLRGSDMRISLPQMMCFAIINNIFEELVPDHIYVCFTRCDEYQISQTYLENKLASFKEYCGIRIKKSNVLQFQGDDTGIEEFVKKLKRAKCVVNMNEQKLRGMAQDLNLIVQKINKQAPQEGKQLGYELEFMKKLNQQQESDDNDNDDDEDYDNDDKPRQKKKQKSKKIKKDQQQCHIQ